MAPPTKLAIATSSVQRLLKEKASYHKEQEAQAAHIQKLEKESSGENSEFMLKQEVHIAFPIDISLIRSSTHRKGPLKRQKRCLHLSTNVSCMRYHIYGNSS